MRPEYSGGRLSDASSESSIWKYTCMSPMDLRVANGMQMSHLYYKWQGCAQSIYHVHVAHGPACVHVVLGVKTISSDKSPQSVYTCTSPMDLRVAMNGM